MSSYVVRGRDGSEHILGDDEIQQAMSRSAVGAVASDLTTEQGTLHLISAMIVQLNSAVQNPQGGTDAAQRLAFLNAAVATAVANIQATIQQRLINLGVLRKTVVRQVR